MNIQNVQNSNNGGTNVDKTLKGEFIKVVNEASDLTEDEKKQVLETGLAVLQGR